MTKEIWKKVIGFPKYEVSNMGRVKSYRGLHPKILKGRPFGYRQVGLYNKGIRY